MGIFDDIKNTADAHEAQVEAGIDKAGDAVDRKTGSRYAEQVDQAQDFAKDWVGAPEGTTDQNANAPQERA
ncbi:antitoxin [Propioniciclava soli]|uniref:Antitoxin n=1 Tax=Propioniciclava soli TaxID=2775081 RepID=A0ABZ3CB57_9ACTN|nr:antitoxin [Propioniciclava soli]